MAKSHTQSSDDASDCSYVEYPTVSIYTCIRCNLRNRDMNQVIIFSVKYNQQSFFFIANLCK